MLLDDFLSGVWCAGQCWCKKRRECEVKGQGEPLEGFFEGKDGGWGKYDDPTETHRPK